MLLSCLLGVLTPISMFSFGWNVVEEEQVIEVVQASRKGKAKQPFYT